MVKRENPVYLFVGQDRFSKDIRLKRLRQEHLSPETEQFNLDILYAKEITLHSLQERLLCLPVEAKKRIIVVKDAELLKEDIKGFLLKYVLKPYPQIILILYINRKDNKDEFTNHIYRYASVYHFREEIRLDTFTLSRQVNLKRTVYALKILNQLLKNGERPERILGGLRFTCETETMPPLERRRRLMLLLNCDIDIKTGRLKPLLALEKLIVSLCGLQKPFA